MGLEALRTVHSAALCAGTGQSVHPRMFPWDSFWPSAFLLTLQKCSAEVARKWLKVLNASGGIWYERKRNSSMNREGGMNCFSVGFTWCSLVPQRAHRSTAVAPFTVLPPREDVDLLLEASELGRCGGVGSVISSGDFQTRNRSEWITIVIDSLLSTGVSHC